MAQSTIHLRVAFGETDAAGIVYFPNYLRWFDQGTEALFRSVGLASKQMLKDGCGAPIHEAHARYLAPLTFDDEIDVTSRVAEIRHRAFRVEHAIHRNGQLVCEGYEVRIWVRFNQPGQFCPEPLPDEVRSRLQG